MNQYKLKHDGEFEVKALVQSVPVNKGSSIFVKQKRNMSVLFRYSVNSLFLPYSNIYFPSLYVRMFQIDKKRQVVNKASVKQQCHPHRLILYVSYSSQPKCSLLCIKPESYHLFLYMLFLAHDKAIISLDWQFLRLKELLFTRQN